MVFLNRPIETTREIYRSPVKRMIALVGIIILIEIVIMLLMEFIAPLPTLTVAILDSLLLVTMLAPVIYFLIFQPMAKYVSDHKEIERSLSNEKDFVESLIRTANVIIVGLDMEGRINLFNETAEKITGYKFAEIKGKNWFDVFVPQEKYPQVWEEFVSLTRIGNMPKTFENPILTKSGEERVVSWQNGLLHEGVKITGSISFGIDITERIKADKSLLQLNRQHQLILNSAAEGILGLDLNGNHTFCNEAAAKMLGYSGEELIGRHSHSLWHHTKPDGSINPESECYIYSTLKEGTLNHNISDIFWRKDGSSFPVNYSSTPIHEDGRIVGAVVTFTDTTDRIQKEEETLKFKLGIECSTDAIYMTDADGRITYVNESFEKVFGYSKNDTIGQTPRILKSGQSTQSFYQSFWKTLLNRGSFSHEIVNRAKDGRFINIDSSNNPLLDTSGNILGFLSVNRDISERKQREVEVQILSEIGHSVSTTANLNELMKLLHNSLKKVL